MDHYANKMGVLARLFGTRDIALDGEHLRVGQRCYQIVDDVIVLLDNSKMPGRRSNKTGDENALATSPWFSSDIQFTFGEEWKQFPDILPDHSAEMRCYFDLVDINKFSDQIVLDLGCGIGRWSYFLAPRCKNIVAIDFSEAIFVARKNLYKYHNTVFLMADITDLPLGDDCCDFLFCVGVLHHLPIDCLEMVRVLSRLAPRLLIYVYYALDNRPRYYRTILLAVDGVRNAVSHVRSSLFRRTVTNAITLLVYVPLILTGNVLQLFGKGAVVPLWEWYRDKSYRRIKQDVYDRFFTSIEQRVARTAIKNLHDTFTRVTISGGAPYWHFLCER